MSGDPSTVAAVLAVLLPTGGLMGYVRKGSVPSLAAGSLLGSLYAWSWYTLQAAGANTPERRSGVVAATLASVILFVAMLLRSLRTRKPLPFVLTVVGGAASLYFYRALP